jgi:hypothetical protein
MGESRIEETYVPWDAAQTAITFRFDAGRITLFRTTLDGLGYPEFYRFLFNPAENMFAIQACGIDDPGSHQMPELKTGNACEVSSKDLVRLIYRHCGWKRKFSYRIPGTSYLKQRLVNFNLDNAFELHEGRLAEPELL